MYAQVFENVCKATESALKVQQEIFRTWTNGLPAAMSSQQPWAAQVQGFQKKWAESVEEIFKKQQGALEVQFNAGQKLVDKAFNVTTAKDPEEFRAKLIEYGQKSVECLQQMGEAQIQAFQAVITKGIELAGKATPVSPV